MFKKKKAEVVPDGDDYADDTAVYKTRRELDMEVQRRHFKVRAARGGDPKHTMARNFNPWFLEPEKPPDIEEGMTYMQIFLRRAKLLIILLSSTSLFDYAYLILLTALIVAIPMSEEEEIERGMVVQITQFMSLCAAVPVLMAFIVRMTMVSFLKENSNEKSRRFWGLFFFIALKVFNFVPDVKKILPAFIAKKIPNLTPHLNKLLRRKQQQQVGVANAEDGETTEEKTEEEKLEEGGEGGGDKLTDGNENQMQTDDDTSNNSEPTNTEMSAGSNPQGEEEQEEDEIWYDENEEVDVSDDDEEFDVAENEVVWSCRVCNNFNLQEKAKEQKSLKSRRIGTKENSDNIKIVIKTRGRVHEHYIVEFKHLKNVNHCWKCHTPMDYKPRKCADELFYRPNDYFDQLHAVNEEEEQDTRPGNLGAGRVNERDVISAVTALGEANYSKKKAGRDAILAFENKPLKDALLSTQIGPMDKSKVVYRKMQIAYHRFIDPEPLQNQVLYNDFTFKTRLKEFMPFLDRRELQKGERYSIGDEVEAIERRPVWYPGVIKRAGANGTYDIIYDNGDLVETVLPMKIRFRQTYRMTRLVRFVMAELLGLAILVPMAVGNMYTQPKDTILNPIAPEYYQAIMAPFVAFIVLTTIAIFCTSISFFLSTAQAGVSTHLKLFIYIMLPYICSIGFVYIVNEKMAKEYNETSVKWYHASIAQFFWSYTVCMQMRQINYFFGMCCVALSLPITVFGVILAITLDEFLTVTSRFFIYAPLFLFCLMLLVMRLFVPFVRSSKF
ncbi:hypothetical protein TrVE_jg6838 [Triparma verrucosa]|uniref:Uncharacterized protein n=1 Tax=Triparma verrucosa TaxID=1606542 RepID=A0A9W7ES68_9STRA|nr:hypothetical protein TrVE_jg6838 [Triparma verrucosa]